MKTQQLLITSFFMIVTILFVANYTKSASPAIAKLPKEMITTALPLGSFGYSCAAAMGETIKEQLGVPVRVIGTVGEIARLLPLRTKEAHFGLLTGMHSLPASFGWFEYSAEEWGPQPLRIVWLGKSFQGFATRGDAGIKTVADLKGKRIGQPAGSPGYDSMVWGALAFGGLTEKDVKMVWTPSSPVATEHVIAGTADSQYIMVDPPKVHELAASRPGIYWVPFPKADVEGWKRKWKWSPYLYPETCYLGAGISKDKPVELSVKPYPVVAYRDLPEEYAYAFTKGVWEGCGRFYEKHAKFRIEWSREVTVDYKKQIIPYHDGTVKFFKEAGVWTPAMEEWQREQVRLEAGRLAAWAEAKAAAGKEKIRIGTPAFAEFWRKWLDDRNLVGTPQL